MKLKEMYSKLPLLDSEEREKMIRFLSAVSLLEKEDEAKNNIELNLTEENLASCTMNPEDNISQRISYHQGGYFLPKGFSVAGSVLPVVDRYLGKDGGYVAFYTHSRNKRIYSVGDGVYVVGVVRMKGCYIGRIFHPENYEHQDISALEEFKDLGRDIFQVDCWAGGDTGGWFGLG